MNGAGGASGNTTGPGPGGPDPSRPSSDEITPDLKEALRQVSEAGRSSLGALSDASKAFRSLFAADVSLARSAVGRTLAFAGFGIAAGASAWLLIMATAIAILRGHFGLSWTMSMLLCAVFSMIVTGLSAWGAMHYFEHTRLKATRRQLARLGFGELANFTPTPGSARSAKEVAGDPLTDENGEPIKDKRGVPVTPP